MVPRQHCQTKGLINSTAPHLVLLSEEQYNNKSYMMTNIILYILINLCQTQADVGLHKLEVTNMIQNGMSCDSVVMYYDRTRMASNYDVKLDCRYLDTLKNNGFKILRSVLEYTKDKVNSKWQYIFYNSVRLRDLKTKTWYSFDYVYVAEIDKWRLYNIIKQQPSPHIR